MDYKKIDFDAESALKQAQVFEGKSVEEQMALLKDKGMEISLSYQMLALRKAVLRPQYSMQDCVYPEDAETDAIHFIAQQKNELTAISSLYVSGFGNFALESSQKGNRVHTGSGVTHHCDGTMGKELSLFLQKELGHEARFFRLRGMAVKKDWQGKGIGQDLLDNLYEHLADEDLADGIWCNARVTALGFYQKMGFSIFGPEFQVPGIGAHHLAWMSF